jgi:RHS repeat-associated protein
MRELSGLKAREAFTMGGQTYTTTLNYDVAGQLTGYTYPDGSLVARTYTARGQLHQLKFDGSTIDTRVYDNGGRMTSSTYSNGVAEARTYNNDNTLASIAFSGAAIGTYSYGWDDNKNKTSETITGAMSGYGFAVGSSGYDEEDRLLNWERTDSNLDQSWDLSLVGDWDSFTENSSTQNRTHGPTHELLTAGGQSLTHDTKGNMTLIPSGLRSNASSLALTWDFENKMKTADVGNNSSVDITYKWDALGRRVYRDDGTSAFVYVQVGQQTIADYGWSVAPASPKYNYVYASYIDEPVMREEPSANERLFFHRSQQFSTVALTTSSATIAERYAYSAYGAPTVCNTSGTNIGASTKDNRITYTGREWDDELALYHFRARLYDAGVGRFLGRDSLAYFDGFSLYRSYFVPNELDPWGLCKEQPGEEKPCKGKLNNKAEEQVYYLCFALCMAFPIKDPTDICNQCDKMPSGRAKTLCDWLCNKMKEDLGFPSAKEELCKSACCSGKLPDGVPGDKCLREIFKRDELGNRIHPKTAVKNCLFCCEDEYPDSAKIQTRCKQMCELYGGGF